MNSEYECSLEELYHKLVTTKDKRLEEILKERIKNSFGGNESVRLEKILKENYLFLLDDKSKSQFNEIENIRSQCLKKLNDRYTFKYLKNLVYSQYRFISSDEFTYLVQKWKKLCEREEKNFQKPLGDNNGYDQLYESFLASIHEEEGTPLFILKLKALIKKGYIGALRSKDLLTIPIFKEIRLLDLYDCKLRIIPTFICNLVSIEQLSLGKNMLLSIPNCISRLNNLKSLSFEENYLSAIPEPISNLQNLQYLYLNKNQITTLPDSFSKLQKLKLLNLPDNRIRDFPNPITFLGVLRDLSLENNNIDKLPQSIGNLKKLTYLNLKNNSLKCLPSSILNLKKLKRLDLTGNKLPVNRKYVSNNPIESDIPSKLIEDGNVQKELI